MTSKIWINWNVIVSLCFIGLTGCAGMKVTKFSPDPGVSNMSMADRYQRYQRDSLGFVGKTVVDGKGNTLSVDELKRFLADKNDHEALNEYSTDWVTDGFIILSIAAFVNGCISFANQPLDKGLAWAAITPYAYGSYLLADVEWKRLFNREGVSTYRAVRTYNAHLRQKLGLESPPFYWWMRGN